jgi:hypothetical protein
MLPVATTNEDLHAKLEQVLEELAADKKKAKEKEAAEAWTKPAAVSIVILAVLGATAVQRQGSFGSRSLKHTNSAIYRQVEASNQWAYFQAKSTKANLYEAGAAQVRALPAGPEQAKALAEIDSRVEHYRKEQEPIKAEATRLEGLRDDDNRAAEANALTGAKLGMASLTLQIAIALDSICVVIKKKYLWYAALALGLAGAAQLFYTLFAGAPTQ